MIEEERVSSPSRPPRYHPRFTIIDQDGNEERFFTQAFRTAYAAHHYITTIITACTDRGIKPTWPASNKVVFTDPETNRKLIIKEDAIEDIIEHEPKASWTPPYPQSAMLSRTSRFWDWEIVKEEPTPAPEPRSYPTPNRHRTTKAPPSPDQITVAQLAQEANIPANKARQILRKNNFQKPPTGWTYDNTDPQVQKIRDLFAKG